MALDDKKLNAIADSADKLSMLGKLNAAQDKFYKLREQYEAARTAYFSADFLAQRGNVAEGKKLPALKTKYEELKAKYDPALKNYTK